MSEGAIGASDTASGYVLEYNSDECIESDVTTEESEEYDSEYDQVEYENMMNFIEKFWKSNQEPDSEEVDELEKKRRWRAWQRICSLLSTDTKKLKTRKVKEHVIEDVIKTGKDSEKEVEKYYERNFRQKLDEIYRFKEINSLLSEELKAAAELIKKEKKLLEDHPIEKEIEHVTNEILNLQSEFKEIFTPEDKHEEKKENFRRRIKDRLKKVSGETAHESIEDFSIMQLMKNAHTQRSEAIEREKIRKDIVEIKTVTKQKLKMLDNKLEQLKKHEYDDKKFNASSLLENLEIPNVYNTKEHMGKLECIQFENRQLKTIRNKMKSKVFELVKSNQDMKINIKTLLINKKRAKKSLDEKYASIIAHENVFRQLKTKRDEIKAKYTNFLEFKNKTLAVVERSKEAETKINEANDEIETLETTIETEEKMIHKINEDIRSLDVECYGLQEFVREGVEALTDVFNVMPSTNEIKRKNDSKFTQGDPTNPELHNREAIKQNKLKITNENMKKTELNSNETIKEKKATLTKRNIKTSTLNSKNSEDKDTEESEVHNKGAKKVNKIFGEYKEDIELKKNRRHNLVRFLMEILNFGNDGELRRVSVFENIANEMLHWKNDAK